MNMSDVNACMFHRWYDNFKHITPKSLILALTTDFKGYLLSDGLFLPTSASHACRLVKASSDDESDVNVDDWMDEDENDDQEAPDFGIFEEDIVAAITDLGGEVFPKLNWTAPQDAAWVSFDHSLKCTQPSDIYLLLKSSDFVTRDLTQPFIHCEDADKECTSAIEYYLVLKEWVDMQPGLEFRCVVKDHRLIAIAQRHYNKYYEFIPAMKQEIVRQLTDFFAAHISSRFPLSNYVFDVYRDRHKRWRLIDFNPFGAVTDSPLFPWSELINWTSKSSMPEFRYIESQGVLRPSPFASNSLPQDITDLCTGQDANKMVDFLKLQQTLSHNQEDSSSDDGDTCNIDPDVT